MSVKGGTDSFDARIRRGEVVLVGTNLYALCDYCGGVVCLNKFLVGSVHLCIKKAEKVKQ